MWNLVYGSTLTNDCSIEDNPFALMFVHTFPRDVSVSLHDFLSVLPVFHGRSCELKPLMDFLSFVQGYVARPWLDSSNMGREQEGLQLDLEGSPNIGGTTSQMGFLLFLLETSLPTEIYICELVNAN